MEFRLLGPFEVVYGERRVDLGPRKQRAVLAVLALEANRVVSLDQLIDELWAGEPPAAATGSLQAYISNLRRALEPDRKRGEPARIVVTQAPGYVLRVEPEVLDIVRFESAAAAGHQLLADGQAATARKRLKEALSLWRGPALADFVFETFAQPAAGRLEERRLRATEDLLQAELDLGRHAAAVAELEAFVGDHPLRERAWWLLMLALYRCGRQADALRAYQSARRIFGEELGLEPGPALRQLEGDILVQASSLDWQPPAGPTSPPVRVRTVSVHSAPVPDPSHHPDRPFVGRLRELVHAEAALGDVAARRGGALWIAGEAGIGKTRLAEELVSLARQRDFLTAWGGSLEGGGTPAYWPWAEAIRTLLDGDEDHLREALHEHAVDLAQIVPEVKELTGPLDPPIALDPEAARLRLFEAVGTLLSRMGRDRGLVVVLDDLQWADVASLQLLGFLGSRVSSDRLLLVCMYRPAEIGPTHPLGDALAALARHQVGDRIELAGLSEQEVGTLIEAISGSQVAPEMARRVRGRTEGNPFFVAELARLLHAQQELTADAVTHDVPAGVRDVVRLRLARLPEQTRAVLSIAAVAGRVFELGIVERAAALATDQTIDAIEVALASGMIIEDAEHVGRFRFTHDLVREAIAEEVSALRRARLHARVAEAMEALPREDASHTVELANHFLAASGVTAPKRAVTWAMQAAEAEAARLGYEQAERLLRQALALLRRSPTCPGREELELGVLLQLMSLVMTTKGFASPDVGDLLPGTHQLCVRLGETGTLVRVLYGLMAFELVRGDHRAARRICDQMLDVAVRSQEPAHLLAAHQGAGVTIVHQGDFSLALEHFKTALSTDALHDPWLESWFPFHPVVACWTFMAWLTWTLGDEERAWQLARDAVAFAKERDHDLTTEHALHFVAWLSVMAHDVASARNSVPPSLHLAKQKQFAFYVAMGTVLAGWLRAQDGDSDGGAAEIREGLDAMAASGSGLVHTFFLALLSEAYWIGGRLDDALEAVEQGLALVEANDEHFYEAELHRLRGELLLAASPANVNKALRSMELGLEIARAQQARPFELRASESLARLRRTVTVPKT